MSEEEKKKHGGPRPNSGGRREGAGRKPSPDPKRVKVSVAIDVSTYVTLLALRERDDEPLGRVLDRLLASQAA